MSMLSSQVDELRELATRYDELQVGAVKTVKMPPNMGSILRDAADTIWQLRDDLQRANAENASLRERVDAAHMSRLLTENENDRLREQMERLVTLLRVDCDIEASWDGLRRFWSIGLTEDGCLMRDRACKAEAENAKLRELCRHLYMCNQYCDREDSNGGCSACPYQLFEYDCGFEERLLKLGIEVDG